MNGVQFRVATPQNQHLVDSIYAGDTAQYWVHYNSYWLNISENKQDIMVKLVYHDNEGNPIGFIAFGQHYEDGDLTIAKPHWYEIVHLVIDEKYQGKGYGRMAVLQAIDMLKQNPDCEMIVIAHHPDNIRAHRLYTSLGFVVIGENYEEDTLLTLAVHAED